MASHQQQSSAGSGGAGGTGGGGGGGAGGGGGGGNNSHSQVKSHIRRLTRTASHTHWTLLLCHYSFRETLENTCQRFLLLQKK